MSSKHRGAGTTIVVVKVVLAMSVFIGKIAGLAIKQIAKPVSRRLETYIVSNERAREVVLGFAGVS